MSGWVSASVVFLAGTAATIDQQKSAMHQARVQQEANEKIAAQQLQQQKLAKFQEDLRGKAKID